MIYEVKTIRFECDGCDLVEQKEINCILDYETKVKLLDGWYMKPSGTTNQDLICFKCAKKYN